jgi:hypothetical protein
MAAGRAKNIQSQMKLYLLRTRTDRAQDNGRRERGIYVSFRIPFTSRLGL